MNAGTVMSMRACSILRRAHQILSAHLADGRGAVAADFSEPEQGAHDVARRRAQGGRLRHRAKIAGWSSFVRAIAL